MHAGYRIAHRAILLITIIVVVYMSVWSGMALYFFAGGDIPSFATAAIAHAPAIHIASVLFGTLVGWGHALLLYRRSVSSLITGAWLGVAAAINLIANAQNPAWENAGPWLQFTIWILAFSLLIWIARSPLLTAPDHAAGRLTHRILLASFGSSRS